MKKTVIFALILMPIIALAILLFSGDVVNRSTHLYVEQVEFVEDNIVLDKTSGADVSHTLLVNVYPMLATNKEVEFWSEDESIAVVDENGIVTSVGFGETYIYVKSKENGAKIAYCKVFVTSEKVHFLQINNPIQSIYTNESYILNVSCFPKEAKDVGLKFESSNPDVLEIGIDGTLVPKAKGVAKITVSLKSNPSVKTEIDINVKIPVQAIYIDDTQPIVSGLSTFTFPEVKFYPDQSEAQIIYESSDDSVASVSATGEIVFKRSGVVEIRAKIPGTNKIISKQYSSTMGYISSVKFEDSNQNVFNFEQYSNQSLPILWSAQPANANLDNVWLESSNSRVVEVQGKLLIVKGGGTATISICAKSSATEFVQTKNILITINKKVESLNFGVSDLVYTGERTLNLDINFQMPDATETVVVESSDESVAVIKNGTLEFTSATIKNKFGKVKVTAKTSNVTKSIVVIYVANSVEIKQLDDGVDNLTLFMPGSTSSDAYLFRLAEDFSECSDVDFKVVSGKNVISQNGHILKLEDKGVAVVEIYKNGQETPSRVVTITVVRLVEQINNVRVTAKWEDGLTPEDCDISRNIYTSSRVFEIQYSLYPSNTTLSSADVWISDSSIATYSSGVLTFKNPGAVKVKLSADNSIPVEFTITSTFGIPDANSIKMLEKVELNKDENQTINLFDLIESYPYGANRDYISFSAQGDAIEINNQTLFAVKGGSGSVTVSVQAITIVGSNVINQTVTKTIPVYVSESATSVGVENDSKFIYSDLYEVDISDRVYALPESANKNTQLIYSVNNSEIAEIGGNGKLTFKKAGKCIVKIQIATGEFVNIAVVYVGNLLKVNEDLKEYKILEGTTVVIIPSAETLCGLNPETQFVVTSGSATISDDIFITVNNNATISFGGKSYAFECVKKISNVTLSLADSNSVDKIQNQNITGLNSITLIGDVSGTDKKYLDIRYSSTKGATISDTGVVTFEGTNVATITYQVCYKSDIIGTEKTPQIATYSVKSTLGEILSVIPTLSTIIYDFDNQNIGNNILDIKEYISVLPSQIQATADNLYLDVENNISSFGEIVSISNLSIQILKGGSFDVGIYSRQNSAKLEGISVIVNRMATAVYLDGQEITDNEVVSINKSSKYITPTFYPEDANVGNIVDWRVEENAINIGGSERKIVNVNGNRITFNIANAKVKVIYSLKTSQNSDTSIKEYSVYYQTSTITFEVDISSEKFVVPTDIPFSFVGAENIRASFDSGLNVETISDGVYKFKGSQVGTVAIYNDAGLLDTKTIISTSSLGEISGVQMVDYDFQAKQEKTLNVLANSNFITASKSIKIIYDLPVGYDKNGNAIRYQIKTSDNEIAGIEYNYLVFKKAGAVKVTISVVFDDIEESRNLTYDFYVQSTFEQVTNFNFDKTRIENLTFNQASNKFETIIFDNLSAEQKVINVLCAISRTAPLYGSNVEKATINSSNTSVAIIENQKVKIIGSGSTVITVIWGETSAEFTVNVDKYIDELRFVNAGTQIVRVLTKSETFALEYQVLNNSNINPTLLAVDFSSPDCIIENQVAKLSQTNKKYTISLTAKYGKDGANASAILEIVRISDNTNIVDISAQTDKIVLEKAKSGETPKVYAFNYNFGNELVKTQNITQSALQVIDNEIQTFVGKFGGAGYIELSNGKTIDYIVTEQVEGITFNKDFQEITAQGDKSDQKHIDILDYFGVEFYPLTARNQNGAYALEFSTSDASIAGIEEINRKQCLVFYRQGSVVITFTAGDVCVQKSIHSTMGYAYNANLLSNSVWTLDKQNVSTIELNEDQLFQISPQGAYKYSAEYQSTNNNVFAISGKTLTLVGGGSATLKIKIKTSESQFITLEKPVYVINRAQSVTIKNNGKESGYIVTNLSKGSATVLDIFINSIGGLSNDYTMFAESSDTGLTAEILKDIDAKSKSKLQENATANYKLKLTANTTNNIQATVTIKIRYANGEEKEYLMAKVLNSPSYSVKNVEFGTQNSRVVAEISDPETLILSPLANSSSTLFDFEVIEGVGVISINDLGEITKLNSGKAVVKISDSNGFIAQIEICIYKYANVEVLENNIVTAKKEWGIAHVFSANDTLFGKTINYSTTSNSIATVSSASIFVDDNGNVTNTVPGGKITFTEKGTVTITISIQNLFTGVDESVATFAIRSTFGEVEQFDISIDRCEIDSDKKASVTVSNIYPVDFSGELLLSSTSPAFEIANKTQTEPGTYTFDIVGVSGGSGQVMAMFAGKEKTINVTVLQMSTGLEIQHNNTAITEKTTFSNTLALTAVVKPIGKVQDSSVIWSVEEGNATVENGVVKFNTYGKVKIKATATDKRSYAIVEINYIQDITSFDIIVDGNVLNGQTTYLNFNQNELAFSIKTNVAGFENISGFEIDGVNLSLLGATKLSSSAGTMWQLSKVVDNYQISPYYEKVIRVVYSSTTTTITRTFTIIREGIKSISFEDNSLLGDKNSVLDNTTDKVFGLQSIRLFGNQSYYGGVQNYFKMKLNLLDCNDVQNLSLLNNLIWTSSSNKVNILTEMGGDRTADSGVVYIDFSAFAGSSVDEIYNDNFNNGKVKISATTKSGKVVYSYTFHIVSGLNVWTASDYINSGSTASVVLHHDLGNTSNGYDSGSPYYLYSNSSDNTVYNKTTIYGNGHFINLKSRNDMDADDSVFSNKTGEAKYKYRVVKINNLINTVVYGTNSSDSRENNRIQFRNISKIAYCELYYMFRSVEGGGTITIKNTSFASFKECGIIMTNAGNLFLENIVMFDTGTRAIEIQIGSVYLSGDIKIYNFQNQSALSDLVSIIGSSIAKEILSVASSENLTITGGDGDTYANIVGTSTKNTNSIKLYYGQNGSWSEDLTPIGIKRLKATKLGTTVVAWAYMNPSSAGNELSEEVKNKIPTWDNEYIRKNSKNELNVDYMVNQITTLKRKSENE